MPATIALRPGWNRPARASKLRRMSDDSTDRYDNDFARLAFSVLPAQTSKRLAYLTGFDQRLCQRWLNGEYEAPPEVIEILLKQQIALAEFGLGGEIKSLFQRALADGIHPEAAGSWFWMEYEKQLGRPAK